jgi:hypothetical protein
VRAIRKLRRALRYPCAQQPAHADRNPPRSFTALRDRTRWRVAVVLCVIGLVTMAALWIMNMRGGRNDSVRLAEVVFVVLALCLGMLLWLPKEARRPHLLLALGRDPRVPALVRLPARPHVPLQAYVLPPTLFF